MNLELDQFKDVYLVIDRANDSFVQKQFVSQGDYKGRSLTVQITNNGIVGEVPGLTLNLNWHNEASGLTDLTAFTVLDKANSIFRIEYPDHMMTPGKVYANIQVIQDGKVTNLQQFELIVQKLAGQPVGIVGNAEFSALVAVLADSNKFRTDIDRLSANKADKTALSQTNILLANELNGKVDKNGAGQITLPMLSTDVKTAMTGGSVAVVGKNAVLAENIVKDTISPDEVGFVSRHILSNTLVDDTKIRNGGYYDAKNGSWIVRDDYASTGLIPCVPGQSYSRTLDHGQISYYDKNVSPLGGDSTDKTATFKVPDNTDISYMRVAFEKYTEPNFTVNIGTTLLEKDSYKEEYSIDLNLDIDNKIESLESISNLQSFNSIGDVSTAQYRSEKYKTTFWLTKINRDTFSGGQMKPKVRLTSSSVDSGDPKSVLDYIADHDTMCCINAGLFDINSGLVDGKLIIDGAILNDGTAVINEKRWTLGIKGDGSLSAYDPTISASAMLQDGCESAVTGFVPIIMNGLMSDKSLFSTFQHLSQPNPRQVICQTASGDYFVFSCDGKKDGEEGLTMEQIGNILLSFGVTFAYNLDGGGSTQTFVKKRRINRLIENRPVPSIIVFE